MCNIVEFEIKLAVKLNFFLVSKVYECELNRMWHEHHKSIQMMINDCNKLGNLATNNSILLIKTFENVSKNKYKQQNVYIFDWSILCC